MEDPDDDAVAVIGIGCNFPGGEGLDNFWKVLLQGQNCVGEIPAERFNTAFWFDADDGKPGKMQTTKAALIEGFNEFDHKFFGITETESDFMDPQQKLLLQCTYRALEDAGVSMETISGSRTGVYIGLMNRDYEMLRSNNPATITHYIGTGTATSVAANRISFTFNLTGPSFAIDSACSSSLAALHLACQALKQGECEMALCGGVSCIIEPRVFVALSKAKMISPEGASKPFSKRADGYGRGEGCGVVLLKPLKNALRHCNKIWGVISKTAVNQDGRSVTPITKPSMTQQEELLRGMYSESDIADVQYIEAHGTGTPVGDPIEAGSISNVIAKARPPGSETLRIGSVKSNIGHTESAAGVAGLIKVLLMMKHQTFVPTVFYSEDSSSIDVKTLNLNIPCQPERWDTIGSVPRVAGINSFGFGGTNAHVILREYNKTRDPFQNPESCPKLFVLSAATEKSLIRSLTDTHEKLSSAQTVDLPALCYTSACGRSHHGHRYRKAFLATSLRDLQQQLACALKSMVESTKSDIRVVFVFCGNGVAYRGMCQQLMREVPVFRDKVREVETLFQRHGSSVIAHWLAGEFNNDDFNKPDFVQPVLFATQVAIASLLKHWGVNPDAVLGHSVGEVAAAHCSGLLSLEDAVKVLHHRSSLQSKVTGGKMLVVGNVAVEKVLEMVSGQICVAAFNSPRSCTLSGDSEALDVLQGRLKTMFTNQNIFLHVLEVPAAYHSHMMDPIVDDIKRDIGVLEARSMEFKLFSTVTADRCSDGDFTTGRYWSKNIREPVLFEQALRAVTQEKSLRKVVFVEIGPRRVLQKNICETLGNDARVLSSVQPPKDYNTILSTLAKLFELGINMDWHQVYRGYETLPTTLPIYQFDNTRKDLNFEDVRKGDGLSAFAPHPLISQIKLNNKEYTCNLSVESTPYLWEHKNNGTPIVPGAFYVELAFASVMARLNPRKPVSSLQFSFRFESLFTLGSNKHQLKVLLEHTEKDSSFQILSAVATHASGTYRSANNGPVFEEPTICLNVIFQRCRSVMRRNQIYATLSQVGFQYGSVFKQLHEVHLGAELKEAVTNVQVPAELLKNLHDYFIHPVLLDNFLQMTALVATGQQMAKQGFPSEIGSVAILAPLQENMFMYLRVTQETKDFVEVCGCFSTPEGKVLVELKRVRIAFLGDSSNVLQSLFFHNETVAICDKADLDNCEIKALVFEDELGIAEKLKLYLHPGSIFLKNRECWKPGQLRDLVSQSLNVDMEAVLFIWGVENLNPLSPEQTLEALVTLCEHYRQILLALKERKPSCAVYVITYRSSERNVDHISGGFVLSGMTRACAAEMANCSFQLIDLASVTTEDIQMLVHVIRTCRQHEVLIDKGQASATRIVRTSVEDKASGKNETPSVYPSNFALQTADALRVSCLSAGPCDTDVKPLQRKSVEVQLTNACVHTSDYFPVTTSHLNFGKTLYWNEQTTQNHKLLLLDFCGIVTDVGEDVQNLKVGDHVASCYPVAATGKVTIPEAVCYDTKRLLFLKHTPCVSYFILAWEILQRALTIRETPQRKLTIVSSHPASALIKVLALTANRSGWNVSSQPDFGGMPAQSHVFVVLPPFGDFWQIFHDKSNVERCVIFVTSSHMSSSHPANRFAAKSENVHVHILDVADVLQRAKLQVQSRVISDWLVSLGFDAASLPLRREIFQLSRTKEPCVDSDSESYFTTKPVRQVVLDCGEINHPGSVITFLAKPERLFKQGCVYIVTGGLSGLGLETVKFIAHHGGGRIVTLSRRGVSEETQSEMELLQKRYVTIMNLRCDVSVSSQVEDAIAKIGLRFSPCPIKGVFHSAAVLHDALIENLDEALFRKVLQPKVSGALNLHFATLHNKLDYFVCYSSISSFIGNASQCNYAAANSFLDLFCLYRRNLGLAGQSVNWGPLNLGLLLNKSHFQKFLEEKGMMIMSVGEVHEALERCLEMNRAQQVVCRFNFKNLNVHVLSQNASLRERLSTLVEQQLECDVRNKGKVEHSTRESVRNIVSDMCCFSAEELGDDLALCALGIDSMLAMTLQNRIFQETGVNVPLVRILDPNSTLATLATIVNNNVI